MNTVKQSFVVAAIVFVCGSALLAVPLASAQNTAITPTAPVVGFNPERFYPEYKPVDVPNQLEWWVRDNIARTTPKEDRRIPTQAAAPAKPSPALRKADQLAPAKPPVRYYRSMLA